MGIKGLSKVIGDHAPKAITQSEIKNYFGRKVAIDASMSIYQFLIAVRQQGESLQSDQGETTSHLLGLFHRTIRLVENGIKPLYVFDGKPPDMKSGELVKRLERRVEAEKSAQEAKDAGNMEHYDKFTKRTVKVTKEHNEECRRLLKLMGIPYIEAPCEAEAQCAALCKMGKVFAAGSEDMDTLTFASPVLLRHLTFSEMRKMPIVEIHLEKVLEGLEMSMDEFIDLCILLGCDYCESIRGIGPMKAVQLIKQYKSIENILEKLDKKKYPVPENWPYERARELFKSPEVLPEENIQLKWTEPDEEGLVQFLVKEKQFSEDRVRKGSQKLLKNKTSAVQGRLDSFFKVIPSSTPKRKSVEETPKKASKKTRGKKK